MIRYKIPLLRIYLTIKNMADRKRSQARLKNFKLYSRKRIPNIINIIPVYMFFLIKSSHPCYQCIL